MPRPIDCVRVAFLGAAWALTLTSGQALAQAAAPSMVPDSAFYVGLGGSFNSIDFGTQDVYAIGTSDIYQDGALVATGTAAGPASFDMDGESGLAPSIQGGYFRKFSDGGWLWGAKFGYSYLDTSSEKNDVLLPQGGEFTYTDGDTVPFTGNAVVRTYRTEITHQMSLMPLIGRTFERGFLYAGAGPTLSRTRTDLDGLVGFADINGNRQDISGVPQDFTGSDWVYGGAATVGATYFLDPSWFVDLSYTYARTNTYQSDYSSTFSNPGADGRLTEGTLVGDSSGHVVTQAITFTMNWAF